MVTASGLKLVPKSTEPPKRSLWDHYIKNIITGTFYDIACHVSQGDRNVSLNFKKTFFSFSTSNMRTLSERGAIGLNELCLPRLAKSVTGHLVERLGLLN